MNFTQAILRQPAPTVAQGITTQDLGQANYDSTLEQHAAYAEALRACGLSLTILPPDDKYPDGHYIEDNAVMFKGMAFLTRLGAASREHEAESLLPHVQHLHVVQMTGDEARLEGGDVLFCADRVLIGISKRTNLAGAEQLKFALQSVQADLKVDFVPFEGVLHLKTGLTELTEGLLLQSPHFHTDALLDFAQKIILPPDESYAANVLPINDTLLMPLGYPTLQNLAEDYYAAIIALEMSEFKKMDGGLTCLSLRF